MKRFLLIFFILLFVAAIVWTGFYFKKKSEKPPVIFKTETPVVANIIKKTVATGSVVPRKEVEIKPRVSGIIDELYVEAGDFVKKGDLIARVQIIPDMVTLNSAETRVNRAQIAHKNAKAEYERNKGLFTEGVISDAVFKGFELSYNNAIEELSASEDNLALIKSGSSKRSGKTTNTLVRSTVSGMVLEVPVEEGNSVIESNTFNDGTTIASIANMEEMIFEGKVDESEVGKLREGMDLLLIIGAIENEKFNARLEHIAPKGVEENGAIQFEIRAAMKLKEDQFIRANYSANADIVLARADSVLTIQESLLQFEDEKTFVEVETGDQQFEKRFIETGLSDGISIEVISGLTKEDKVKNPNASLAAPTAGRG
jgi:HlyD family secretion protein